MKPPYDMEIFKDISGATASRDLKKGVELNLFKKIGNKIKPGISYDWPQQ